MINSIEQIRTSARTKEIMGDYRGLEKLIDFVFDLSFYDFITRQERMGLINEICEMRVRMRAKKEREWKNT